MSTHFRTGSLKPHTLFNLSTTSEFSYIPHSIAQAMSDPNWKVEMDAEMLAPTNNNTWDLVPRPPTANIVGFGWLYRYNLDSHGYLDRDKGRLVAHAFSEQLGLDFNNTFSPFVKTATICTILSMVVSRH